MSTIVSGHLEVLYGWEKGQKKGLWFDEEKRSICGQALLQPQRRINVYL